MVETEGVKRSLAAIEDADIAITVLDGSVPPARWGQAGLREVSGKNRIIVINKADLPRRIGPINDAAQKSRFRARPVAGLDALREMIAGMSPRTGPLQLKTAGR